MLLKYNASNPDFVNTSEAYSSPIFIGNNNIAIPYINLGLMSSNPINRKQSVVDYSYYVITGVRSIFFNGSKDKLNLNTSLPVENDLITESIIIGGYKSDNGAEVTLECKDLIFYLPSTSHTNDSLHSFIPRDTPRFKKNINTEDVNMFFVFDNLPDEIKMLLGNDSYSLIWY